MRAVTITAPGGPEVLALDEVPSPVAGAGEVLVRVRASGVNRADLIQREGHYPAPPGWPADIPGLEFSGTVEAVGEDASGWTLGDRVMGIVGGGGYAECLVTDASTLVRVPDGLGLEEAGAIPEAFMTAFDAVFLQGGLEAGETLLVHAAGSGVGTAAIQLGHRAGARTVGTSRTREKIDRAAGLGLDAGIVAEGDWTGAVLAATGGGGADVILDLVGGAYLEGNQKVLAACGRHIVVGVPSGREATLDLRALMAKRGTLRGTVLRARPVAEKAALARAFEASVLPGFTDGALEPIVDRMVAPELAADAHRRMAANKNYGKIVILWD